MDVLALIWLFLCVVFLAATDILIVNYAGLAQNPPVVCTHRSMPIASLVVRPTYVRRSKLEKYEITYTRIGNSLSSSTPS